MNNLSDSDAESQAGNGRLFVKLRSGLIDRKHVRGIGASPLFLLIHLMHVADWESGTVNGYTDAGAADSLGLSPMTIRKYRRHLEGAGYASKPAI